MISKEDCFNSTPLPVEFMRSMQVISPIISWWLMEISTETNSNSNLFVGFFFIFSYYFIYSAPIWYLWLHLLLQMSRRFISIFGRLLEVRIIYIFIITILKPLFKQESSWNIYSMMPHVHVLERSSTLFLVNDKFSNISSGLSLGKKNQRNKK